MFFYFKKIVSVALLLSFISRFALAEEILNRAEKIKIYNEKTLYFQRGFFFTPDRFIQNNQAYAVGSPELNQLLSAYPACRYEMEKYQNTWLFGAILLGAGVLICVGGLYLPGIDSNDPLLMTTFGVSGVIAGIMIGVGGIWLMNSDIKQNYLYKAVWYYNESVLFEDQDKKTGKKEIRINLFSYQKDF